MSVRRATAVASAVLALLMGALFAVAAAADYSGAWQFRRYDQAAFARLAAAARAHHRVLVPVAVPPPHLGTAVDRAASAALLPLLLGVAALALARGGRRSVAFLVAASVLLGSRANLPDLPLLVSIRPDVDPNPALWLTRVAWSAAAAVPVVVLIALAGRRLPRPAVGTGRLAARLLLPATVVAIVARLATEQGDRVAAAVGAAVAVVVFGALATAGYRRPWLSAAVVWLAVAGAAFVVRVALDPSDSWLPDAVLPAAGLALLGGLAATGVLGAGWARLVRHGPALGVPRAATRPS